MASEQFPQALSGYFARASVALALAQAQEDNALLKVNPVFCSLTGYDAEDVVGRNCRLLQRDADNGEARRRIRAFLAEDAQASVRTPIVNFRKDGQPFVNLLYMSKLRASDGRVRFLFASQFDVSRAEPERLAAYDAELSATLSRLAPPLAENGIALEGTLLTIANTAALIAQAKLTLDELDDVAL